MDDAIKSFSDNSTKNVSFFESALASMTGFLGSQAVLGVFGAVKDAAAAVFGELLKGADAAIAEEQALKQLATSLALSGQYSKDAQASLQAFAGSMEELTGVQDDVVAKNLAVLSSMTKLSAEGLMQAQKAALDLSAAFSIDLETATRLVGKGIEGNVEAFKKYGIEVQAGKTQTENFANVLSALSGLQGSAAASMQTFGGALKGAENAFGNFTEELATAVTKNPVFLASLQEIAKIFTELTDDTKGSSVALKEGLAGAFLDVTKGIMVTIEVADEFIRIMKAGILAILLPIDILVDSINGLKDSLSGVDDDGSFKFTQSRFEALTQTIEGDSTLDSLNERLARVYSAGETAFGGIKTASDVAAPAVANVTDQVHQLTEAEIAHNEAIKSFAEGLAKNNEAIDASYKYQTELLMQQKAQDLITNEDYFTQLQELQAVQFETEQAALDEALANKLISETQYADAQSALMMQQNVAAAKMSADKKKAEDDANKTRIENLKSTFGTIATLQSSSSQELAAIGKAAAIAQATMDGYAAVQKALSAAPPPFNFGLAALVGAATAANVAKIAGVGLARGINEVPGIGTQDNFPTMLAPGERVVPAKSNEDLNSFLQDQNENGGGKKIEINITIQNNVPASREAGAAMVEALNDYLANGGLKILGMQ